MRGEGEKVTLARVGERRESRRVSATFGFHGGRTGGALGRRFLLRRRATRHAISASATRPTSNPVSAPVVFLLLRLVEDVGFVGVAGGRAVRAFHQTHAFAPVGQIQNLHVAVLVLNLGQDHVALALLILDDARVPRVVVSPKYLHLASDGEIARRATLRARRVARTRGDAAGAARTASGATATATAPGRSSRATSWGCRGTDSVGVGVLGVLGALGALGSLVGDALGSLVHLRVSRRDVVRVRLLVL